MNFRKEIKVYLTKEIETLEALDVESINTVINVLFAASQRKATVYICGNGGSAATASHFVCDFNKGVSNGANKYFKFVCLNDNMPVLTAIANDISYDDVFQYQLQGILNKEDVFIAISGSGNSVNVIKAAKYAKTVGCPVIALTGYDGGVLKTMADFSLHVPINDMQITEDNHMIFDHMIMQILNNKLNSIEA